MKLDFCAACDSKKDLHHHHLLPKVLGGSNRQTNLITLCATCHEIIHELRDKRMTNSQVLTIVGNLIAEGKLKDTEDTHKIKLAFNMEEAHNSRLHAESLRTIIEHIYKTNKKPTLSTLAAELNALGQKTSAGGHWTINSIYKLLYRLGIVHKKAQKKFRRP